MSKMPLHDFRLRTTDDDYILEIWGGSTKHPDVEHSFNHWLNKHVTPEFRELYPFDVSYTQWLSFVASTTLFVSTTFKILEFMKYLYMDCQFMECKPSDLLDVPYETPYNDYSVTNRINDSVVRIMKSYPF